jgi:D-3-phosphoglycerate dehydrogenase
MAATIIISSRVNRPGILASLRDQGFNVVEMPIQEPNNGFHQFNEHEVAQYWYTADAAMVGLRDFVTKEVLQAAPNLKCVCGPVIGTEMIDVKAASDLGIAVGFGAIIENFVGVAEACVMLSIELLKRLPEKWNAVRTGGFRVENAGHMVKGSTIGLIGLGNIGQATARRFQGFGCRLLAYDPYQKPEVAASVGVTLVDKETLFRESDVVSIMVTLTDETSHLVGEPEFALMKPGAYLINTARGGCVDEEALKRALDGTLGGAAIDVWAQEPTTVDHPLRTHPKVIATGHNVGHSVELYEALTPAGIENLSRGAVGRLPLYLRNPEVKPAWRERLTRMGVTPRED